VDIGAAKGHVRFTPESGHCLRRWLDKLATAHIGDRAIQSKSVRSVFARIFSRRNPWVTRLRSCSVGRPQLLLGRENLAFVSTAWTGCCCSL